MMSLFSLPDEYAFGGKRNEEEESYGIGNRFQISG